MKTSNKLLLGIFLIIIILTTVTQLVVYAKYKRGEFTAFKREQFTPMISLPVPAVRFISMKGFGSCAVKPSGTLKIEIQRDNAAIIKYHVVNDTLVIISDSTIADEELERKGGLNNSLVNIHLPASVLLKGAYCDFRLWGAKDAASAPSYNISLEKSAYLFININGDKATAYFNQLNINSVKSVIDLNDHAVFNGLNLQLVDSKLNDNNARIEKITMGLDDNSSLNLSGKNVKALK